MDEQGERSEPVIPVDDQETNGLEYNTEVVQFGLTVGLDYNTGVALIKLKIGGTEINLVPDASAQIALELLKASYQARIMSDLYQYALTHNLNMKDLGL